MECHSGNIHSGLNEFVRVLVAIVLTVFIIKPQSFENNYRVQLTGSAQTGVQKARSMNISLTEAELLIDIQDKDASPSETKVQHQESNIGKQTPQDSPRSVCFTKRECQYAPIILSVANQYEVDPDMIKAIIKAESGYNPEAVSRRGARGLMQLMPTTARSLGVTDMHDPEHNIEAGVKYFKQLLEEFDGRVELALAAYNAGIQRVKKYQGVPPFKATRAYIRKVFQYYKQYKSAVDSPESI